MTALASLTLLLLCATEAWRPRPSLLKHSVTKIAYDAVRLRGGDAGNGPCIGIDLGEFDCLKRARCVRSFIFCSHSK
jgi:hypothetical protein